MAKSKRNYVIDNDLIPYVKLDTSMEHIFFNATYMNISDVEHIF